MNFRSTTRSDDDVIGDAIGGAGGGSRRTPAKRVAPSIPIDETQIARIKREVSKRYKRDFNLGTTDRIVAAIEYLTQNYPGVMLPLPLLHWMSNPGPSIPNATRKEVLDFSKRVSRCKRYMLTKYGRTFFIAGGSKMKAGFIRGYESKEEMSKYEQPKAAISLVRAHQNASMLGAAIGPVTHLKEGPDFTSKDKEAAREYSKIVTEIGRAIKGYLPAAPPKPPTGPKKE